MSNLIGQILSKRYRVEEFIGRGGMAEVYKVWDRARATFLALKLLRDDLAHDVVFVRRFQREARNLEKLQHPNIVRFYGLEQDDLLTYILMDYVEGSNLRAEIYRNRHMGIPHDDVAKYMQGICSALHYAHHSGIIHCDLKSGNVLIDEKGRPLVTDFGIARMTDTATTTLVGAGTPAYMAPEQILGKDPNPQTDIYTLGITLFEMLTGGERPFTGEQAKIKGTTSEKVRWEQIYLPPPSPRIWNKELTPEVEAVVMKCLGKEPGGRYESALELLNDLKRAMLGMGVEAMPGQIERIASKNKKRLRKYKRRWSWAVVLGSVFLVVLGLAWSIYFGDSGRQMIFSLIYSPTPTATATATSAPTATATPTHTLTFTPTATNSGTPTWTSTATNTQTPTATSTQTPSKTPTPTNTPTITASATNTPTNTFTISPTPTLLSLPLVFDDASIVEVDAVLEISSSFTCRLGHYFDHPQIIFLVPYACLGAQGNVLVAADDPWRGFAGFAEIGQWAQVFENNQLVGLVEDGNINFEDMPQPLQEMALNEGGGFREGYLFADVNSNPNSEKRDQFVFKPDGDGFGGRTYIVAFEDGRWLILQVDHSR